jgi:microcompartment protein CcmL/EutN
VVAIHVIPRPHANVDRTLPLGRGPAESSGEVAEAA